MEIMSHWLNNGLPISFPKSLVTWGGVIKFGVSVISMGQLLTLFGSVILVITFFYFLNKTKLGRVLRAVAQNSDVAQILGIPIDRIMILSFIIAGLMAGIVAVLLAMSLGSASSLLADDLAIKCIAILLFAGMGNLRGGLICALILGIAEGMTMGYLPGQWVNAVAFSVIMVALIFKPQGIFGVQN